MMQLAHYDTCNPGADCTPSGHAKAPPGLIPEGPSSWHSFVSRLVFPDGRLLAKVVAFHPHVSRPVGGNPDGLHLLIPTASLDFNRHPGHIDDGIPEVGLATRTGRPKLTNSFRNSRPSSTPDKPSSQAHPRNSVGNFLRSIIDCFLQFHDFIPCHSRQRIVF